MIFDAHLDLAMNHLRGRDITQPARDQPVVENEIATVGLPDLRAGGVTCVCGTIFCEPQTEKHPGYRTPQEAYQRAIQQLDVYDALIARAELSRDGTGRGPRTITLLEGAECIRTPDDVPMFHARGVRIVGLAWQATRYAGGTATPGPITPAGRAMVKSLDAHQIIHDASHLAEQSFWDLINLAQGPVIASHSNSRAIVGHDPNERHLSDDMIRAIIDRDGVIGINFFDRFLLPHDAYGKRRATLDDVVAHIRHVCELAGNTRHVGLGTDMDGGLGREQIPVEIKSSADLPKLTEALESDSFSRDDVEAILYENWARMLGAD